MSRLPAIFTTALLAEGATDRRFLSVMIQRTIAGMIVAGVGVPPPTCLTVSARTQAEKIGEAAREAAGYHLLFVHADADSPDQTRAMAERIEPGLEAVRQAQEAGDRVCRKIVPVIPVQMTEAWLLADAEALRQAIGTGLTAEALDIPLKPGQIEGLADPKERLNQIVATAVGEWSKRRRGRLVSADLFEPLAATLPLESLQRLPSYQQFTKTLATALQQAGLAA